MSFCDLACQGTNDGENPSCQGSGIYRQPHLLIMWLIQPEHATQLFVGVANNGRALYC